MPTQNFKMRTIQKFTSTAITDFFGASRHQLARRMHRVFGLSTGQWLLKVRLDKAQRLLRETDTPIGIVAQEAGYSDQIAFGHHFRKRATGLTPREYRATWGRQTRVVCLSDCGLVAHGNKVARQVQTSRKVSGLFGVDG
jgi:AraC-like DNA-binding protein